MYQGNHGPVTAAHVAESPQVKSWAKKDGIEVYPPEESIGVSDWLHARKERVIKSLPNV